ncbi:hypothetical protein SAMN05661099_3244 [Daejeonella lutea]|uniref:Uncharacterized protein n=1 Tax=Daejeonella lutea TaxID=572036 RepID=A0A1T5EX70_9SPHI|nr:hypothetical protein SAMN05661099_3244 [Daejeonella lutea]
MSVLNAKNDILENLAQNKRFGGKRGVRHTFCPCEQLLSTGGFICPLNDKLLVHMSASKNLIPGQRRGSEFLSKKVKLYQPNSIDELVKQKNRQKYT